MLRVQQAWPDKDIKVMKQSGKGKGNAVREAFAIAQGEILMILDADLTTPPEDMIKFYDALANNHGEFINGCRLVYPMEKEAMRFLNYFANKFFGWFFSYLLGQRLKDTLCGTKVLFKKDYELISANRKYFGEFDPFGDFDLLFWCSKTKLENGGGHCSIQGSRIRINPDQPVQAWVAADQDEPFCSQKN